MRNKKTVNLRLSMDVYDYINELAKVDDRSFNNMVERILRQWIDSDKN